MWLLEENIEVDLDNFGTCNTVSSCTLSVRRSGEHTVSKTNWSSRIVSHEKDAKTVAGGAMTKVAVVAWQWRRVKRRGSMFRERGGEFSQQRKL